MNVHSCRTISTVLGAVGLFVLFIGLDSAVLISIGIALLGAGLLVQLLFWRCPSCGRYLGRPGLRKITHCPFCGSSLLWRNGQPQRDTQPACGADYEYNKGDFHGVF